MQTISAIIRVRPGEDKVMLEALLAVADHVRLNEPDTIDFYVSQAEDDPCLFTTYERFADKAAMDLHNGSDAVAAFFAIARPILDGPVTLVTALEKSEKA